MEIFIGRDGKLREDGTGVFILFYPDEGYILMMYDKSCSSYNEARASFKVQGDLFFDTLDAIKSYLNNNKWIIDWNKKESGVPPRE